MQLLYQKGVLKPKTPICHLGYSLMAKGDICEIKESQPEVIGKFSKSVSSPHVEQSKN